MSTTYADYAIDLAVDVVSIFFMAYLLYFRRHRRADLLLAYVTLNIGIFVAMSLLGTVRVDIALGFGLFAILSIIRLRSSTVTQQEVAYYFVALVMGLVNGMNLSDRWLVAGVNVLLLMTMFVVDSRPLRERARRMDITLDVVHSDDASLIADLESRLNGQVMHHVITEIDYVRDTMVVDVRYRAGRARPPAARRPAPVRPGPVRRSPVRRGPVPRGPVPPAAVQRGPVPARPSSVPPAVLRPAAPQPAGHGDAPMNAATAVLAPVATPAEWAVAAAAAGGRPDQPG